MKKSRLFILALDGTPFTLLQQLFQKGVMPNLKALAEESVFKQMDSVLPAVSSSAWSSFMTGKTPAQHGILGFVDRTPADMNWYIPNADQLRAKTIWQILSEQGKRVFVMNVPVTFPPRPINGISVCGFLGNDIRKGTWPPEIGTLLKARGYRIDADTEMAKTNLPAFMEHLFEVLEKRIETMRQFYAQERWDVFMTHIMETDRLHHFFWEYFEQGHLLYKARFEELYRRIDAEIGRILDESGEDSAFLLLSDHGFCTLRHAVYLNRWLSENGYLEFKTSPPSDLHDIAPQSRAYSLYPGRIYVNLKGREKEGTVEPGLPYEQLRTELAQRLKTILDPFGRPVVKQVLRREEAYPEASAAELQRLPDLIAVSHRGYDLKGDLWYASLFDKTIFNGMHTDDDAFVLAKDIAIPEERFSIDKLFYAVKVFFDLSGASSLFN